MLGSCITAYGIEVQYFPISRIHPGQNRYAQRNVDQKKQAAIKKGTAKLNPDGSYTLAYDNGKSILAQKDALPVVKVLLKKPALKNEELYILVDGHHDVLASLALGASTVPVKIIKDFGVKNPFMFWNDAEKNNYIFPYTLDGKYQIPPSDFKKLTDDPNRYFAAIAARKCELKGMKVDESTGAEYPLWIKIGKDIPFIEFKISDVLNKHGLVYDYKRLDETLPEEFVEKARTILIKNPIQGLKLIPKRVKYTDIHDLCSMAEPSRD